MKKAILFFTTFGLLFFASGFSGCGDDVYVWTSENYNVAGENQLDNAALEKGNEFLEYLLADDIDAIKNMFCERTLLSRNFDEQLQNALDFIDGKIISYGKIGSGGGERSIEGGRITRRHIAPYIENIVTDSERTYEIIFYMYTHYDGHYDVIGISQLVIKLIENNEKVDYFEVGEIITSSDVW
jgi:hypothetical protein